MEAARAAASELEQLLQMQRDDLFITKLAAAMDAAPSAAHGEAAARAAGIANAVVQPESSSRVTRHWSEKATDRHVTGA